MSRYRFCLLFIIILIVCLSCKKSRPVIYQIPDKIAANKVVYAGARSSSYGIKPFPKPDEWQDKIVKMSNYFGDATPCAIWIVGVLKDSNKCYLQFPGDSSAHRNTVFAESDKHEEYLTFFDEVGIKVYLQVEPASADVPDLIDLVLKRYKHHPSVIGFGIDVEWYREIENRGWGVKVEDEIAEAWEKKVKSHNRNYTLFLKHWDREWMPPNYRGNIIFISDSQMLENFNKMLDEFVVYWADYFKPNPVYYQIGYRSDHAWWGKLDNPPKDIGSTIAQNVDQPCGIFWVDFTLRQVFN